MSSPCDKRVWWKTEGGAGEEEYLYRPRLSSRTERRGKCETNGGRLAGAP
jgi:hypothetical protein